MPKSASAFVIAGPQLELGNDEIALLDDYLHQGGSLLVLLNPNPQAELRELTSSWWMSIDDGVVVDPVAHVTPNFDVPLVDADRNQFRMGDLYFPGATAVRPQADQPDEAAISPLAWTTAAAWLEKGALGGGDPSFDENVDVSGSFALGAQLEVPVASEIAEAERHSPVTRLAVIGDSDFASNQHFGNGNNSQLFLTVINWLGEGDEVVSVDRKVVPVRRLVLKPEEVRFINLSTVGLLPLILLIVAARAWWRRR